MTYEEWLIGTARYAAKRRLYWLYLYLNPSYILNEKVPSFDHLHANRFIQEGFAQVTYKTPDGSIARVKVLDKFKALMEMMQ
ncbi:MAG: hypothetical protein QW318_07715 [Candidatus Caldarchaeum sp.]